jgi:hypothetical protein
MLKNMTRAVRGLLPLWALASCLSAQALVVRLDTFTVQSTAGAINIVDTFTDGVAPPSGPAGASTYNVTGTFVAGDETGGKLTLNTDAGDTTVNANGGVRQTIGARLITNVNPASTLGLAEGRDIFISGLFDAVVPQGPQRNGYGIEFADFGFSNGSGFLDRSLQLLVQYHGALGGTVVRLLMQDFAANTITTLAFAQFNPAGADQILLSLSAAQGSSFFQAGFDLLSSGQSISSFTLGSPQEMFLRTGYGRGRFLAFTEEVPEPAVGALLAMGGLMLAAVRRRQRR